MTKWGKTNPQTPNHDSYLTIERSKNPIQEYQKEKTKEGSISHDDVGAKTISYPTIDRSTARAKKGLGHRTDIQCKYQRIKPNHRENEDEFRRWL